MKKTMLYLMFLLFFVGSLFVYKELRKDAFSTGQTVWILPDYTAGIVILDYRPVGAVEVHYKDKSGVYHTESLNKSVLKLRDPFVQDTIIGTRLMKIGYDPVNYMNEVNEDSSITIGTEKYFKIERSKIGYAEYVTIDTVNNYERPIKISPSVRIASNGIVRPLKIERSDITKTNSFVTSE